MWLDKSILSALHDAGWVQRVGVEPLSKTDASTLEYIRSHPNEETGNLAATFGIRRSAMCARLARLAQRGLVVQRYESGTGGKIARWRAK